MESRRFSKLLADAALGAVRALESQPRHFLSLSRWNSAAEALVRAGDGLALQRRSVSALRHSRSITGNSHRGILSGRQLSGDAGQQGATDTSATSAVNNLLAESDPPPRATNTPQPGDPFYQPPPATSVPNNGPFPDNEITIDWGDSQDQPDPTMFDTLKQNLRAIAQGVEQKVSDALAPVIDQTRQAIHPAADRPRA